MLLLSLLFYAVYLTTMILITRIIFCECNSQWSHTISQVIILLVCVSRKKIFLHILVILNNTTLWASLHSHLNVKQIYTLLSRLLAIGIFQCSWFLSDYLGSRDCSFNICLFPFNHLRRYPGLFTLHNENHKMLNSKSFSPGYFHAMLLNSQPLLSTEHSTYISGHIVMLSIIFFF